MKKFFLLFTCFFTFLLIAFALDFPSDSRLAKSFFGQKIFQNSETYNYSVENGISFENAETVQASEFGKNILVMEENKSLTAFPSPLGNAVILLHENDIQSIYANLADVKGFETKENFLKGEALGYTASNQRIRANTLLFKIIDTKGKKKNFVNPLLLLAQISDKQATKIEGVFLEDEKGNIKKLTSTVHLAKGRYKLFVEGYDSINESQNRLNPFEISANLNGNSIADISFETMTAHAGKMFLNEKTDLASVYKRNRAFYLCDLDLAFGNSKLAITMRDCYKNSSDALFEITVF